MAPNLELREPESSATVIPIFRYDHTPIPNYFFDVLLPLMTTTSEIKIVLILLRVLSSKGEEEIITNFGAIGNATGLSKEGARLAVNRAENHGILEVVKIGTGNHGSPSVKIKIIKRINYKRF